MRVEKAYSPALLTKIVTPSHVYSMKELTQTYGLDIEKSSFKKSAQALSKEISEASPSSSLLPSATPSPSIKATASTSFPIIPVSALMVLLAAVVIYLVRQKEL
jgi:hypothetical protein